MVDSADISHEQSFCIYCRGMIIDKQTAGKGDFHDDCVSQVLSYAHKDYQIITYRNIDIFEHDLSVVKYFIGSKQNYEICSDQSAVHRHPVNQHYWRYYLLANLHSDNFFHLEFSKSNRSNDLLHLKYTYVEDCHLIGLINRVPVSRIPYNNWDQGITPLTEIPDSISKASELQYLDLSCNNLISLPNSVGNLSKLEFLDIRCNFFTSIPTWLDKLENLQELCLAFNPIPNLEDKILKIESEYGIKCL